MAMITVEYETEVVVDGDTGSMVIVFLLSFRAVAVPSTSVNFSAEYSLNPSAIGTKALSRGMSLSLIRVRGAPIFQKKCVEGEMRMTL